MASTIAGVAPNNRAVRSGSDTASEPRVTALGARVHQFLQPEARERFISLFRDVLRCETKGLDFGLPYPILLVSFSDGSGFSVECSDLAPEQTSGDVIDDDTAFRLACIEFRRRTCPSISSGCARPVSPNSVTREAATRTSVRPAVRSSG